MYLTRAGSAEARIIGLLIAELLDDGVLDEGISCTQVIAIFSGLC